MPAEDDVPRLPHLPSEDLATGLEPAAGRLLVASPMLVDPNFARSVVLLLDVDDNGALGVVLNRPGEADLPDVLEGWRDVVAPPVVLFDGGPVSPESALGVATIPAPAARAGDQAGNQPDDQPDSQPVGWRAMFGDGALTCGLVDLDAPVELVRPALASLRIYAGYAGWSGGQLEDEIALGGWFVVPGSAADAASPRAAGLWGEILRRQGGSLAWVAAYPADPTAN